MRKFRNYQGMKATVKSLVTGKYHIKITDCKGGVIVNKTVDSEDEIGGVLNKHGDGIWIEQAT